jgi:hypothetical protein
MQGRHWGSAWQGNVTIMDVSINRFAFGTIGKEMERLATVWQVRGSNPGGGEIFRTCPERPWGPLSLQYNRYLVFSGIESGRGVTLTPHPFLLPRRKTE